MFIVDCFDIGSKYYGKSNHNLFFELIKMNQFTCKLYTSYKPSQYILLINLIHFIEKICKIYGPITYIFRTQFVNFISKLYTSLRMFCLQILQIKSVSQIHPQLVANLADFRLQFITENICRNESLQSINFCKLQIFVSISADGY